MADVVSHGTADVVPHQSNSRQNHQAWILLKVEGCKKELVLLMGQKFGL